MSFNLFDRVLYINLNHRKDRKQTFLKEAKRVGIRKVQRIDAKFDLLNGNRGCLCSHIRALECAKQEGITLILEDDCYFAKDLELLNRQLSEFFNVFGNKWDVFFLGGRYEKLEPIKNTAFCRILESARSHAYAVNGHYVSTLKQCFLDGYKDDLREKGAIDILKALDVIWRPLQKKDLWYAGKIKVAYQSHSFSDITGYSRFERKYNH